MRFSNYWEHLDETTFQDLVTEHGTTAVANMLGVNPTTVRAWRRGERAPNRRYQIALLNSQTDFGTLSPQEIGERIEEFLDINGVDEDFLAGALNVTPQTARAYIDGERRPRAIRRLATLLSTPTPVN